MVLTLNGKNYIASKFGNSSGCYVKTGLGWTYLGTDNVIYNATGGTSQIVGNLIMTSIIQSVSYLGITYTYAMLKTANDDTDITLDDVLWITQNDNIYCLVPSQSKCITCDTTKNLCILNNCIPKNYILYGGIGIVLLIILK